MTATKETTEKEEYYIITMKSQMVYGPFKSIKELRRMMIFYTVAHNGEHMIGVKRVLDNDQI